MGETTLDKLVTKVSSSLKISNLDIQARYPVFGAQGFVGNYHKYQTDKESIAIIKDGAGVGRVQLIPAFSSVLGTLQLLVPKSNVDVNYLYYLLKHFDLGRSFNGATIPHIYFKDYKKRQLIEKTFNEQKTISKQLMQIDKLIESKEKEIDYLDTLIKSRFNEMFGLYEKVALSKVAIITMGQSPDSKSYNDNGNGIPFFQGKGDYGDKYTIVNHWTTEPKKVVGEGVVLMSVRAPVGPVNITNVKCCIGRGLCGIDALKGRTNNEFLFNALKTLEGEIADMGNGSTFKAINKDDVYGLMIPDAPIEVQDEFSAFSQMIDKSKFVVQQQIKDLKELLDKKMDEYFGG